MTPETIVPILGDWTNNGRALNEGLADALAMAIERGELEPGALLPAERRLAAALNISRGTVVAAYARLRDRQLVVTEHGSGTRIGAAGRVGRTADAPFVNLMQQPDGDVLAFRSADWTGDRGVPEDIVDAARPLLSSLGATAGYFPTGIAPLRQAIARWFDELGLPTVPEQVMVTTGAQQAIALVVDLLVSAGTPVVVEQLSYPGALDALRAAGANVHGVPMTPLGVDVRALERAVERHRPALLYLTPVVNNPTGLVVPRLARRRIAELMDRCDGVLLEDLSLAETQLEGPIAPPIASFASPSAQRRMIVVGSLSKIAWSGLRIGWVRAPVQLIGRLTRHKLLADLGSSVPSQAIAVGALARSRELRAQRVAGIRTRLEVLTDELSASIPEWSWTTPAGGLCLWVHIGGDSSVRFVPVALRHGIAVAPGAVSAADGGAIGHIRLPLGHPPDVLREAVRRLSAAWHDERGDFRACGTEHVIV